MLRARVDLWRIELLIIARVDLYQCAGDLRIWFHARAGEPVQKRQSLVSISTQRNDVRDCRILICIANTVAAYDTVMCTPSTLVAKKLPGGASSTEMRRISGIRPIGNFCDKHDYHACANPSLVDTPKRVEFHGRNSPMRPPTRNKTRRTRRHQTSSDAPGLRRHPMY